MDEKWNIGQENHFQKVFKTELRKTQEIFYY